MSDVNQCGFCHGRKLNLVLSLGLSPVTCAMRQIGDTTPPERYPLELLECQDCKLVQLSYIADRNTVFPPGYTYSSGNNGQLRAHFLNLAALLCGDPHDLVVDLGANDGTFLRAAAAHGYRTVGVEPTGQADKIDGPSLMQPFTAKLARHMVDIFGPARYVTAMNVLAHVDDPHDFVEGAKILLGDDGRFIVENHDLASVVEGRQWDTIYHEHLRYYSTGSCARLLQDHGLHVYREEPIGTHGGSVRLWAGKQWSLEGVAVTNTPSWDWRRLREDVKRAKWYLRSYIEGARSAGDRVAALGATARATTVINYCELDCDDLEAVYEVAGSDKLGHYIPGTHIPVVDEQALFEPGAPEHLVLMSWHLADRLVPKLRENGYAGQIVLPLPKLRVLQPEASVA